MVALDFSKAAMGEGGFGYHEPVLVCGGEGGLTFSTTFLSVAAVSMSCCCVLSFLKGGVLDAHLCE